MPVVALELMVQPTLVVLLVVEVLAMGIHCDAPHWMTQFVRLQTLSSLLTQRQWGAFRCGR